LLIEALVPLTVKLPSGERVELRPGVPTVLPGEYGQKLLTKAPGKVRHVQPDWLKAWRELCEMTLGITPEDPRLKPVLDALNRCDEAFAQGDWVKFQGFAEEVRQAVKEGHHAG
jgi:hypothetical protein